MTRTTEVRLQKDTGWVSGILKLVFFVSVFFAVIFTVMANMGGASDTLKESIEGFVSQTFNGKPAKIERLNNMSFFPKIGFDIEGLKVHEKEGAISPILSIEKAKVYISFWDVILKHPQFSALSVENLKAEKGVFGPERFFIEKMYIDHNREENVAIIHTNGMAAGRQWSFDLGTEIHGKPGAYSYRMTNEKPFTLQLEDLIITGLMTDKVKDYLRFENLSVTTNDAELLSGTLSISMMDLNLLKMRGDVTFGKNKSSLQPEIVFDYGQEPIKLSGTLKSREISAEDVIGQNSLETLYEKTRGLFLSLMTKQIDIDLNADLEKIDVPDMDQKNTATMRVVKEGNNWSLKDIKATLGGADIAMPAIYLGTDKDDANIKTALVESGNIPANAASVLGKTVIKGMKAEQDINFTCGLITLKRTDNSLNLAKLTPEIKKNADQACDSKLLKN